MYDTNVERRWEKLADLPTGVGEFVAMTVFRDTLIVAMQGGVFRFDDSTETFVEVPLTGGGDDTQQPG